MATGAPAAIALGLALGTGEEVTGAGGCFAQPAATPSTSVVVTTDDKLRRGLRRASDRVDARGAVSTTSEGLCEIFPMTPGKEVSNSRILPCRSTSRRLIKCSMTSVRAKGVPSPKAGVEACVSSSIAADDARSCRTRADSVWVSGR
jgi:ribosomal protein S3AE